MTAQHAQPRQTVALCRVSTDRDQSPASQRAAIQTYALAHGFTVDRWLGDKPGDSISGGADHHPDLALVIALAEERQVARLLVTAQDRIGRRGPATLLLMEELHGHGVEIHATQQGGLLDLESEGGELLAGIKATIDRAYRRRVSAATKDGLNGWELAGLPVPRGTPGAVRVSTRSRKKLGRPGGTLPPSELDRARALLAGGASLSSVAAQLRGTIVEKGVEREWVPGHAALRRMLGE